MTTLDDVADGSGVAASGMSYDKLDFTRPERELRPHYTSSSTLRSVKSNSPNSRCLMFGDKHVFHVFSCMQITYFYCRPPEAVNKRAL